MDPEELRLLQALGLKPRNKPQVGGASVMNSGAANALQNIQRQGLQRLGANYMGMGSNTYQPGTPWQPGAIVGGGHTGTPAVPGEFIGDPRLTPQMAAQRAMPTPQQAAPGLDAQGIPPALGNARDSTVTGVPRPNPGFPNLMPTGVNPKLTEPLRESEKIDPPPYSPLRREDASGEMAFEKFHSMESAAATAAREKNYSQIPTFRGGEAGSIKVGRPGGKNRRAARDYYASQFIDPENRSELMTQLRIGTGEYVAEWRRETSRQATQAAIQAKAGGNSEPMKELEETLRSIQTMPADAINRQFKIDADKGKLQPVGGSSGAYKSAQKRGPAAQYEKSLRKGDAPPELLIGIKAMFGSESGKEAVKKLLGTEDNSHLNAMEKATILSDQDTLNNLNTYPGGINAARNWIETALEIQGGGKLLELFHGLKGGQGFIDERKSIYDDLMSGKNVVGQAFLRLQVLRRKIKDEMAKRPLSIWNR